MSTQQLSKISGSLRKVFSLYFEFFSFLRNISPALPRSFLLRAIYAFIGSIFDMLSVFSLLLIAKTIFDDGLPSILKDTQYLNVDLIYLVYAFSFIYLISVIFRGWVLYSNIGFSHNAGNQVFIRLIECLGRGQIYSNFSKDMDEIKSTLIVKIDQIVANVFYGFVQLVSGFILILVLSISLSVVNFTAMFTALLFLISYYVIWSWAVSKSVNERSRKLGKNMSKLVSSVDEGVRSIKQILVFQRFVKFVENSVNWDAKIRRIKVLNTFIAGVPRLGLELILLACLISILILNGIEE
ncbi:hypothetical protein OAD02_05890, partial [Alphaproteobacteria bacterium]|nr:hypothetical protein [Alphaproteobacteria bacterium]